jgi:hypothetical protein
VKLSTSTDSTAPGAIDSIRCAIPTCRRSRRNPTILALTLRHRRRDCQPVNAEPNHVGVARPDTTVSSAGDAGPLLSGSKRELKIATKTK